MICPIRWLACAALLLVSMATPTRAQAPDGNILPDAPDAAEASAVEPGIDVRLSRSAASTPSRTAKTPVVSNSEVTLRDCPYDRTHARICRVHVGQLVISSAIFNAFQNAGNLYTGYWYRYETTHGAWWNRYVNSVEGWRWDVWSDNNPFLDDYVGHPMMGSITNYLWIQNDPKSMTLEQSNTWPYWRRMLRAGAFSTFYSFEWKLGPLGEAAIGHNGDHYFSDEKNTVYTNETGWVELVTTPGGGLLWTIAEDALDKHVVQRLEGKSRNPLALTVYQFLTPSRATANILRFRPPWYRDSRTVKAKSFFSEPAGPEEEDLSSETATTAAAERDAANSLANYRTSVDIAPARPVTYLPVFPRPGGIHEFGAWWGLSLISGHVWGYAKDTKYMPIDVRYSYEFKHWDHWTMRYSPEISALALIDEPVQGSQDRYAMRKRTYGSGVSPVGFQSDFFPSKRVQPFLSGDGGFIYFTDRVLSPQGSQFMYTVDFGTGINIFRKERQAVSIGYRYQHLSNANI
ncbi:MAG TPA: acyloxyacyl hydrolase, partial [Acidobacteriaceae bacterium]|nr:acyloxyacyl hydrolase [Acidobacteriaceae bacterium]